MWMTFECGAGLHHWLDLHSATLRPACKEGSHHEPDPMAARPLLPCPHAAMKRLMGILIATTLVIGSGCAKQDWIDRTLVTVDVTGTWEGNAQGTSVANTLQLELNQQGPNVTGYLRMAGFAATPGSGPIVGSVAGDTFRFRQVNGSGEGDMTVSGDDMTGQIRGYPYLTRVTLGRVNPSSKSSAPPR